MTNTVLLVGNLGADPDTRSTRNDTRVTTISLGTSRPKRDSEGKTFKDASGFTAKETEWHRITCFNGLGKTVAQFATKGMLVAVRGRIHYSKWTDREGVERYGCEIIADDVQFLSRGKSTGGESGDQPDSDDDLPF
ncbi:single-stranded DNA-binding protein [Sphingomonas profundi]|uniref:single-stranded DNA-binding protein n=1 Tax=Alterirhizorhabdus profundi TaxID=2681549 RepID=UPI0012E6F3E4|nr:single-stranded DNA-binding protein [Sphingomonas profundi]